MKQLVVRLNVAIDGGFPGEMLVWPDTPRNRARIDAGKAEHLGDLEFGPAED